MLIEEYYQEILALCGKSPFVNDLHLNFEEIDPDTGYLSGFLNLINGSVLYIAEYVEIHKNKPQRLKYRYHWQKADGALICRWDNVPHHRKVKAFPYHCHQGNRVASSKIMNISAVLGEIGEKLV